MGTAAAVHAQGSALTISGDWVRHLRGDEYAGRTGADAPDQSRREREHAVRMHHGVETAGESWTAPTKQAQRQPPVNAAMG